jgi:hypothetical protein
MGKAGLEMASVFPDKKMSKNYSAEFADERKTLLNSFVLELSQKFDEIVSNEHLYHHFSSFFGPYQMGDVKPPNFILPLPLFY